MLRRLKVKQPLPKKLLLCLTLTILEVKMMNRMKQVLETMTNLARVKSKKVIRGEL